MTCRPVTLASRYSDAIVERGATPNFDIFAAVNAENNPTDAFPKEKLVSVTGALNNVLARTDTQSQQLLNDRKRQGPILFAEVASFLSESGLNIDNVNESLTTFNTQVNNNKIKDDGSNRVLPTPSDVDDIFKQLEYYYSENMAFTISGGVCSAAINPFGKLLGALSALNFAGDFLAGLLNFDLASALGPLTALKGTLEKLVDSLKSTLEAQVKGLVDSVKSMAKNIKQGAEKIIAKVKKMADNIKQFLSGDTTDKLKDQINGFIQKAQDQFKELDAEAIGLLMFRFCQFSEMLQTFMNGPVEAMKKFVTKVALEEQLISSISTQRTEEAANAGAVRLTEDGIKKAKERIAKGLSCNARARDNRPPGPAPEPEDYVATPELTDEQNDLLLSLDENGIPGHFKFAPQVKNMGKTVSDVGPDAGWRNVKQEVYVKLIKVTERMGKTLTLNSAYRSPEYNARIGGASSSKHMSGLAVDVSMSGLSDDDIRQFIRIASQEGFLGIAYYPGNNFTHIDLGSRRTWNLGHRFDDWIIMARNDGFRKGQSPATA